MYTEYFHFTALPFQLTPDRRFFFDSSEHRKALAHLTYGLHNPEGFIVITGEVGAGKTTLIEYLLSTLNEEDFIIGKIATSNLDPDNLLKMIAYSFGIDDVPEDKYLILRQLQEFMFDAHRQEKHVLLIVDEAQNLPFPALEELRMLSNLQIEHHAPLQFILVGQPQLKAMIASKELEQLRQRIVVAYHLKHLDIAETKKYIIHRLELVGWENKPLFTEGAFKEIHHATNGIPRRINTLCSRLLLSSYLEENNKIDENFVNRIYTEQKLELGDETIQTLDNTKTTQPKSAKKTTPPKEPKISDAQKLTLKIHAIEETIKSFESFMKEKINAKDTR